MTPSELPRTVFLILASIANIRLLVKFIIPAYDYLWNLKIVSYMQNMRAICVVKRWNYSTIVFVTLFTDYWYIIFRSQKNLFLYFGCLIYPFCCSYSFYLSVGMSITGFSMDRLLLSLLLSMTLSISLSTFNPNTSLSPVILILSSF